jgi:transposase-like protein
MASSSIPWWISAVWVSLTLVILLAVDASSIRSWALMATLLAVAPKLQAFATCPSCHTTGTTMTNDAVEAGADWQCERCGRTWNAVRLATAAEYALWVSGRDDAGLEVTP